MLKFIYFRLPLTKLSLVRNITLLLLASFVIQPSKAGEQDQVIKKTIIAKYSSWTVLKAIVNGKKVCYTINYSKGSVGNSQSKSKAYINIDYISDSKKRISIHFENKLRQSSKVNVSINKKQYILDSYENFAISTDSELDDLIISRIENSSEMLVRTEYPSNAYAVDKFDLNNFSDAIDKMEQICDPDKP